MTFTINTFQFHIPKRNAQCCKCNSPLEPSMTYFSSIGEENKEIKRHDYCLPCWNEMISMNDLQNNPTKKTHWKSIVAAKCSISKPPHNRQEKALELLKLALASDQKDDHEEAFVLALYLARSRLLYLRQQFNREDGCKISLYEVGATEEIIGVQKLELSRLNIAQIQNRISTKLSE